MSYKDQQLLEEAYKQIAFSNHLHEAFLIEAGLLDKAKQIGGAIIDKAKSMFGNTVAGLLEIVKKTNPQLFAEIEAAVQKGDQGTLTRIFKNANNQQQIAQESVLHEGVVDTVKGLYSKAYNFVASKPELAAKIAIAGIMAAMTAAGPEALSHMAGFLAQVGGRVLGGGAIGGAMGGAMGAVRGGIEAAKQGPQGPGIIKGAAQGAKQGFKKGAKYGAAAGLGSAVGDAMQSGPASISDIDSAFAGLIKTAAPNEVRQLKYIQNNISNFSPKQLGDVISILNGGEGTPKDKIELLNFLMQG